MSTARKTGIALIALVILLGFGYLAYFLQGQGSTQAGNPAESAAKQTVIVIEPKATARTAPYHYNVRIEPLEYASLFARADGFVEERLADIGDMVKKGQLLARLSSPELEEGIKQARAEVNRQRAVVVLAEKMLARAAALKDIGAVSQAEYDERNAEYDVAKATHVTLRARLEQLQNEYAYTRIVAPFDGRITVRNRDRGDRISINDNVPLFRIVNDQALRIIAEIPQTHIYAIDTKGQALLSLPEMPNRTFPVAFDRSAHEIDPALGTMRMEFIMDNRSEHLPSGIAGELRILPSEGSTMLTVPDNSIRLHNGKTTVMLVDSQNRVVLRPVLTGRYQSSTVEILSGLRDRERVIVNPNALLKAGDEVEVSLLKQ